MGSRPAIEHKMFARQLLGLPSFAITGICATVALLSRLAQMPWAMALLICSLLWGFALYSVAQNVLNERAGMGRVTFPVAMLLIAASLLLPQQAHANPGHPLYWVPPSGILFFIVSLAFAVSALLRTEGRLGWVWANSPMNTIVAIAFLPIGVWFLRPRIEEMLQRAAP